MSKIMYLQFGTKISNNNNKKNPQDGRITNVTHNAEASVNLYPKVLCKTLS